jgi:Concanavalin A-like lectin/glucanases superfamily
MNSGNFCVHFDGLQSYIEIPDSPDFSLPTTGPLTVSAWIRPSTLTFPSTEGKCVDLSKVYVHWLGKGETGQQEWVVRMYSLDNTDGRANRISFYVFNPGPGEDVGSYYHDPNNPIQVGVWIHVVGSAASTKTYFFINGAPIASDVYEGTIQPERGTAPMRIGTRGFNSFFAGEIREVRVRNRTLTNPEVVGRCASDTVPQGGLVAEYLLTQDIAPDTAGAHTGDIYGATWILEDG